MPIFFDQVETGLGRAVWRSEDGAEEVALCSVDLTAYSNEPSVRERFSELVSAVADYYRRTHVAAPVASISRLDGLPCATCKAPEADDIRHRAGQISDASELALSPGGYPAGCCRVRAVGVFGTAGHGASAAAAA